MENDQVKEQINFYRIFFPLLGKTPMNLNEQGRMKTAILALYSTSKSWVKILLTILPGEDITGPIWSTVLKHVPYPPQNSWVNWDTLTRASSFAEENSGYRGRRISLLSFWTWYKWTETFWMKQLPWTGKSTRKRLISYPSQRSCLAARCKSLPV